MATPLEHRVKAAIRLHGPMTIADYMALCLSDPEHGYYMAREPFGTKGDFVTAPEVSQMFGELIGIWAVESWYRLGQPAHVHLVELGPGRGTLMADLLRAAAIEPAFLAAARLHLVETSSRLRSRQAATLAQSPLSPVWHDQVDDLPPGPRIVIANEFFDALPIRQYLKMGGVWRERAVGLDSQDRLVIGVGPGSLPVEDVPPPLRSAPDGAILETSGAANAVMEHLARGIARDDGAALVIDYGYAEPATGDSFQAVRQHAYADPLTDPGQADLTAHVNFGALARAATIGGAAVTPVMTQGDFLLKLGLLERAGQLGAAADEATRHRLTAEVNRLAGADDMGLLFKVLGIARAGRRLFPWA